MDEPLENELFKASLLNFKKLKELIEQGINVNIVEKRTKDTPLHIACKGGFIEIVQLLIDNGANVNAKNKYHEIPLHDACFLGFTEIAKLLIIHGADINSKSLAKNIPLHNACFGGQFDTVQLLLEHGTDINTKNKYHETPLQHCIANDYSDIIELLQAHLDYQKFDKELKNNNSSQIQKIKI